MGEIIVNGGADLVIGGISDVADGEALSHIQNLGNQLIAPKCIFDNFEGNINWEDDIKDYVTRIVMPVASSAEESNVQLSDDQSIEDGVEVN